MVGRLELSRGEFGRTSVTEPAPKGPSPYGLSMELSFGAFLESPRRPSSAFSSSRPAQPADPTGGVFWGTVG